jgi:hypothetical protein
MPQGETTTQFAQEPVFLTFHKPPVAEAKVVIAAQMKHAMDHITRQFTLPGRSKPARLRDSFGRANENFTVKGFRPLCRPGRIVERDDVG